MGSPWGLGWMWGWTEGQYGRSESGVAVWLRELGAWRVGGGVRENGCGGDHRELKPIPDPPAPKSTGHRTPRPRTLSP
ncbi:hypothetical protein JCM18897A_37590 [Streptomyces sp. JCM 18897]